MEEEGGKKRNKTQTTEQRETKSHEMNHLQHHQHHHHHDLQQEQNKIRISTTSPILSRKLRRLVFTLIHLFQKNKPRFHCCCYFYSRKKKSMKSASFLKRKAVGGVRRKGRFSPSLF